MAALYAGLGALAALGGGLFGEVASHPATKTTAGLLLVVLGLSLLGLYPIRLPARLQRALGTIGRTSAPWLRAVALGAISGILAASCTGPVLAALLVSVGVGGEVDIGVSLLFAYALGMALPFFALAVLLERLPRSGQWLTVVKLALGAAVIGSGLAIALSAWPVGVSFGGPLWIAAAIGLVGLGLGLQTVGNPGRTRVAAAALAATAGFFLLLQPLLGSPVPAAAQAASSGGAPVLTWEVVRTGAELDAALGRARAAGRPALLEFYASWCSDCRELDEQVFRREDIRRALGRFATIRVDASRVTDELRAIGRSYGLSGVPGLVFVGSAGRMREDTTLRGPVPAEAVLQRLAAAPR
jgi:thiol:disulfide interchange protein DsbD